MSFRDIAAALLVVWVWGVNFVVIKWGVHDLPPLLLGGLRFVLAALPAGWLIARPALPWPYVLAYGLSMGVGQFGLLFSAMAYGMPAGLASVVLQAQAFFTLLLGGLWLGERIALASLSGLLCASVGLWLIASTHGANMTMLGFALTLAAALSWALSNLVVRRASQAGHRPDTLALVVWASLVPPLPLLTASLLFEGPARIGAALADLSWRGGLAVLYLAFIATLVGYSVWSRLLTRHPAGKVAPFSLLVPAVGLCSASWLLDERLTMQQLAGSACVLTGLLIHLSGGSLFARLRRPA
jgi:O-acetylserine/cysteine efflux transporter